MANPTTQQEYRAVTLRPRPGGTMGNTGETSPGTLVRARAGGSTQQSPPARTTSGKVPSVTRAAKARLKAPKAAPVPSLRAERGTYGPAR